MSKDADFIIDQVSWHTTVKGNPETPAMVVTRFTTVACFLESNGLLIRPLLAAQETPHADFSIRRSDLTEEGFQLMRAAYDKYLKQLGKGKPCTDVSVLQKALARIREA